MSVTRRELLGGAAVGAAWALALEGEAGAAESVVVGAAPGVGEARVFAWADGSPAVLVRLPRRVPGGAGPGGDLVAYSALCTHLGCVVEARGERLVCPCHLSVFDPALGGRCVQGPAPIGLPRIELSVASDGTVRAVGIERAPWGRHEGAA